jgi:hypothetical protein
MNDLIVQAGQWVFLSYFLMINGAYLLLNFNALFALRQYFLSERIDVLPRAYSDYEIPISIIVPATTSRPRSSPRCARCCSYAIQSTRSSSSMTAPATAP